MKAILFGGTGMVGQGLLRECLLDPTVERVLSIVRSPTGQQSAKLSELVHQDFFDFSPVESQLAGYDSCFYSAGLSSAGMTEQSYFYATYDMTLAAAQTLARLNPPMRFLYVSGAGTDSSGKGRTMWARVKGKTENALLRLPFKAAYMFRPWLDPAVARHAVKDRQLPRSIHRNESVPPAAKVAPSPIRHHHRDSRPGHDPRSAERTPKPYPRDPRHQSSRPCEVAHHGVTAAVKHLVRSVVFARSRARLITCAS